MKGLYILFSGGYDSSYLINKVLMNLKNENDKETELNLVSLDAAFLGIKSDREKFAREKMLNYWKAKYFNRKINFYELKIDVHSFSVNSRKTGLTQPQFWISSLLSTIDQAKYESIDILFSYICGDQAVTYRHEIETIVQYTLNISYTESCLFPVKKSEKPKIKISFPLSVTYKETILSQLIIDDEFIFDLCTSCEGLEEYDLCGYCVPCRNLKAALNNLIYDDSTDAHVKQKCKEKLSKFHKEEIKKEETKREISENDYSIEIKDNKGE